MKKEKKPTGEAKEVQLTAKKTEDRGMQQLQGGLTQMRRDMLRSMRDEAEENWENLDFFDGKVRDFSSLNTCRVPDCLLRIDSPG